MRKYHIVLLTGQHASANPRVWKEAGVLGRQGYKVTIVTLFYSAEMLKLDKRLIDTDTIAYRPYLNLMGKRRFSMQSGCAKISRRVSILNKKFLKRDSANLLGYSPKKMVESALKEDADLYIGHMEIGLWAGVELMKRGKKVAFDIEDWYSNDYINELRPVELLKKLEAEALLSGAFCTCPSDAMAKGLKNEYFRDSNCHTIYNGFSTNEVDSGAIIDQASNRTLVWFSQVIGPGRGLELLMKAIGNISFPIELNLIGLIDDKYKGFLEGEIKGTSCKLIFHGTVPHYQLLPLLQRYNVGLALENNFPLNKDTTVSNKILQYLQAGLKIIATETEGHTEVCRKAPGTILLVKVGDVIQMTKAIELIFELPMDSNGSKRYFRNIFSLEAQENKLLGLVKQALD